MCYNLQSRLSFTHNLHKMSWGTKQQQKGALVTLCFFMIVYILMGSRPYIKYKPWGITQYTITNSNICVKMNLPGNLTMS